MYKLKYLPLAQKDITSYIADNLKAPKAAMDLVDTYISPKDLFLKQKSSNTIVPLYLYKLLFLRNQAYFSNIVKLCF